MTTNETKTETAARTRIDARQTKMYGTTLAHLRDDVAQIKADTFAPGGASDAVRGAYERDALVARAFSMLSDAQEEVAHGGPITRERARQTINRAKFILDEARLPRDFGFATSEAR
jgi:hypothetical protein